MFDWQAKNSYNNNNNNKVKVQDEPSIVDDRWKNRAF